MATAKKKLKKGPVVDMSNQYRQTAVMAGSHAAPQSATQKPPSTSIFPPGTPVERGSIDLSGANKPPPKSIFPPGTKVERGSIDLSGAKKPPQIAAKGGVAGEDDASGPVATGGLRQRTPSRGVFPGVAEGRKPALAREVKEPKMPKIRSHAARASKAIQVMSIDDYYNSIYKAAGPAAPAPGGAAQIKKFPREAPSATGKPRESASGAHMKPHEYANEFSTEEPTHTKMKPISDEDAVANLASGKFKKERGIREKSMRLLATLKALATGYGKTSGGGALRASNRGFTLTVNDINRAVASPPPIPAAAKRPYLPGVDHPSRKPKYKDPASTRMGKLMALPEKRAEKADIRQNMITQPQYDGQTIGVGPRDSMGSKHPPTPRLKPLKPKTPVAAKSENVVHKSVGDHSMAKTDFNDIFKSELGVPSEEVLCACPHCEAPITKSDLEKAHGGKGSVTSISGATKGKSSAHVRDHNPDGGTMRGGDGHGQVGSSRPGAGIPKQDLPVGVQNSKGSRGTKKAIDDSSSCGDASSGDDKSSDDDDKKAPPFGKKDAKKSMVTIRGTEWVQYVDDGSDAAIAKSIAEQSLTPHEATQPLDRNNDLTRLLI